MKGLMPGRLTAREWGFVWTLARDGHVLTSVLSPSPCALLKDCYEGKI